LQVICRGQDVEAVCIGHFTNSGRLQLNYGQRQVGNVDLHFLHNGLPVGQLEAVWQPPTSLQPSPVTAESVSADPAQMLLALLAHPNIRSKESIIRRYDHEVQGGTVVKPLVGLDNHGPGDAAVLIPLDVQRNRVVEKQRKKATNLPTTGQVDQSHPLISLLNSQTLLVAPPSLWEFVPPTVG
jgi:phosphoribosylformylglycinamidine (FGAM) synthase-like enzyme